MARIPVLARVLWLTAACGRVGFEQSLDATPASAIVAPSLETTSTCGAPLPAAASLAIGNAGGTPLVVASATATNGFTISTALPISIAPGASAMLAVVPPIAVIGTDLGGAVKTGELTVSTSDGDRVVALSTTVIGANLDVRDGAGMHVDLSFSSVYCPPAQAVYLTNTGNADATLGVTTGNYHTSGFQSGVISQSASSLVTIQPIISGACTGTFTVQYEVTGSVCSVTPFVISGNYDIATMPPCSCS